MRHFLAFHVPINTLLNAALVDRCLNMGYLNIFETASVVAGRDLYFSRELYLTWPF